MNRSAQVWRHMPAQTCIIECACLCKSVAIQCKKGSSFAEFHFWKHRTHRANAVCIMSFCVFALAYISNSAHSNGLIQDFMCVLVHWLTCSFYDYLNVSEMSDKVTKLKMYLHDKCLLVSGYNCTYINVPIILLHRVLNNCDWTIIRDKWKWIMYHQVHMCQHFVAAFFLSKQLIGTTTNYVDISQTIVWQLIASHSLLHNFSVVSQNWSQRQTGSPMWHLHDETYKAEMQQK